MSQTELYYLTKVLPAPAIHTIHAAHTLPTVYAEHTEKTMDTECTEDTEHICMQNIQNIQWIQYLHTKLAIDKVESHASAVVVSVGDPTCGVGYGWGRDLPQ